MSQSVLFIDFNDILFSVGRIYLKAEVRCSDGACWESLSEGFCCGLFHQFWQRPNKLLKHRSGAKRRASTGQSNCWSFCAFASLIVAQKPHQFACRLARRYSLLRR